MSKPEIDHTLVTWEESPAGRYVIRYRGRPVGRLVDSGRRFNVSFGGVSRGSPIWLDDDGHAQYTLSGGAVNFVRRRARG